MKEYDVYKYCVTTRAGDLVYKADPYAFHAEDPPLERQQSLRFERLCLADEAWQNARRRPMSSTDL